MYLVSRSLLSVRARVPSRVADCPSSSVASSHICYDLHALTKATRPREWKVWHEYVDAIKGEDFPKIASGSSGKQIALALHALSKVPEGRDLSDAGYMATVDRMVTAFISQALKGSVGQMNEHSKAVTAMALLRLNKISELELFISQLINQSFKYPTNIAQLVYCAGMCGAGGQLLNKGFAQSILECTDKYHVPDVVQILSGYARSRVRNERILARMDAAIAHQLSYMDSVSVGAVLHAFWKLKYRTQNFEALLATAAQHVSKMNAQSWVSVMLGIGAHVGEAGMTQTVVALINVFLSRFDAIYSEVSLRALAAVLKRPYLRQGGSINVSLLVRTLTAMDWRDRVKSDPGCDGRVLVSLADSMKALGVDATNSSLFTHAIPEHLRSYDQIDPHQIRLIKACGVRMADHVSESLVEQCDDLSLLVLLLRKLSVVDDYRLASVTLDRVDRLLVRATVLSPKILCEIGLASWHLTGSVHRALVAKCIEGTETVDDSDLKSVIDWIIKDDDIPKDIQGTKYYLLERPDLMVSFPSKVPPPSFSSLPSSNSNFSIRECMRLINSLDNRFLFAYPVNWRETEGSCPSAAELASARIECEKRRHSNVVFVPRDLEVAEHHVAQLMRRLRADRKND